MQGLYIHIPFCTHICTYCDFVKTMARENKKRRYVDALIKALNKIEAQTFDTVHIGGGTPSCLDHALLGRVIETAIKVAKHPKEVAIECNPNDITIEKAEMFKTLGINRVTLGVQTFNGRQLKALNRSHQSADVKSAFSILRSVGLDNIAVDLIFALPGQTLEDLKVDLHQLIELAPRHISTYELIFEPHTVLYYNYQRGRVNPTDQDAAAQMYEMIVETLTEASYKHYEISNFAKDDHVSLHNLLVWQDEDYIGVGAGAHSKVGNTRYGNTRSIEGYINAIDNNESPRAFTEKHEGIRDAMIMGLRLNEGVHVPTLNKKYHTNLFKAYPAIKQKMTEGLLVFENNRLMLSNRGRLLGNLVFEIF